VARRKLRAIPIGRLTVPGGEVLDRCNRETIELLALRRNAYTGQLSPGDGDKHHMLQIPERDEVFRSLVTS